MSVRVSSLHTTFSICAVLWLISTDNEVLRNLVKKQIKLEIKKTAKAVFTYFKEVYLI